MLYGTVPFKANTMTDLHKLILKGKYALEDTISEEEWDLIKKMLNRNPSERITIPEILLHPWMQNIDEDIKFFNEQEIE